ncbi:MAG: hypothetical protein JNJ55_06955, partial [Betaproteobacteria bacterium]|nr:hypothetical protein [Betaproteobacteria bacterium]
MGDVLVGGLVALVLICWAARLPGAMERGMHGARAAVPAHDSVPAPHRATHGAHARLAESADLLGFIVSVRYQPVPGGHYLALNAYDFCAREARQTLEALGDSDSQSSLAIPPAGAGQRAAQQALLDLCAGFAPRRFADFDFHALAEEGLRMG